MPATPDAPFAVLIMAAGEGTRMKSATPKVLHQVAGRTMVGHAVAAAQQLQPQRLVVIVGSGRELVAGHLALIAPQAMPVTQEPRNGTGHAVRLGLEALREAIGQLEGTIVVTSGDCPLVRPDTLQQLIAARQEHNAAAAVLTGFVEDAGGYGRIVRRTDAPAQGVGGIEAIVEHKDATEEQRRINEINTGFYAFDATPLAQALTQLTTDNAQGEEYLVDVVSIFSAAGYPVVAVPVADTSEALGVNDRVQLSEAGRLLRERLLTELMRSGVSVPDPASVWVDADVTVEPDAVLLPGTMLEGQTRIGAGAVIGPRSRLIDTVVEPGATVAETTATGARIGEQATVGPYTYLRPGTVLGRKAKAGAYVEIKASTVGEGSKVPHLSYVGDAEIGAGTNIGAATVVVNYDGVAKHHTRIGDAVRVGSDSMLVAPVTIGDGAYTAAGSVITEDVPPGALAIGRARQRNVEGWVVEKRPGSPAAHAAEATERK